MRAPDGEWLLEAAKRGDVEIPYFCYERKLGPPVGACRMCMVEIEGMPKLQVSCATPVKDGMVVHTQTDRVKHAQNAVVEFLLVNHPLDCPVCDKGGECPLQDISYGWGPGRSRFVEPKRNFPKPIALSPLVAIDRERCILCYRCVRFSQEVAEDDQLAFLERGDHTFVGTFDGRPYVAPFSGNVIELCPVGALTSTAYRFRARPWDIENSGSVCTLCPSQCNIAFTVRDERVERVLARENPAVDDGWLCDKGRFGYQAIHSEERITQPLIRDGGHLRPVSWERALETAVDGLRKAGAASAALVGGATTNEEGYLLQRILREGLGSAEHRFASRRHASGGERAAACTARADGTGRRHRPRSGRARDRQRPDQRVSDHRPASAQGRAPPRCQARGRRAAPDRARRRSKRAPALHAGSRRGAAACPGRRRCSRRRESRPTTTRHPVMVPPHSRARRRSSAFCLEQSLDDLAAMAGVETPDLRDAASLMVGAESIVILYGERIGHGERGGGALVALADLAMLAGVDGGESSGLLEIPLEANARGLREVGCLPNLGPGLADTATGLTASEIAEGAARGELQALYLLHCDPSRDHPSGELWEQRARRRIRGRARPVREPVARASRGRRVPSGVLCGEGGHRHASGRTDPAPPPRDRPAWRGEDGMAVPDRAGPPARRRASPI